MNKFTEFFHPLPIMLAAAIFSAFPAAPCRASSQSSDTLVQMSARTRLDISKGDIRIGSSSISGITPEGKKETRPNPEGYHITGETSMYTITVESGVSTELLLEDVNISQIDADACALQVAEASGADVKVILRGDNTLKSGSHCAGIQKSCNQTTCVRSGSQCGCGTLTIQCEQYKEGHVCGSGCGTLIASGVNGGAGIGGGDGRKANNIQILGGRITASGGYGSAGIGGGYFCAGSHMEIRGGEVTAVAGEGNMALGGLEDSSHNTIDGDCIVDAGSMGGAETVRGILLNGSTGTINGAVHITKDAAEGILKDKRLTREEGGRLILPDGVAVTTQNTLKVAEGSSSAVSGTPSAARGQTAAPAARLTPTPAARGQASPSSTAQATPTPAAQGSPAAQKAVSPYTDDAAPPWAKGIYGQTLEQLEVADQGMDMAGIWSWADEEKPDTAYPTVGGSKTYTRVFTPEDLAGQEVRVEICPEISYLETAKKATILSPASPDGENGWYKGNVVLEAPDGCQIFHSRSVGWVEELVVADDGGSGDYEYYLREAGTNLTTAVKTIRLNIDSLPPQVDSATVTHVEGGTRIRARASDDTARTEQVSGVRQYYCLVLPKSGARTMSSSALVKNKSTKSSSTGEFTYTGTKAGKEYRLYVAAADEAGNLSGVTTQTFTGQ